MPKGNGVLLAIAVKLVGNSTAHCYFVPIAKKLNYFRAVANQLTYRGL
jgi:hypothetical protein